MKDLVLVRFHCQRGRAKSPGKGESELRDCPDHTGLCPGLWGIVLIDSWCGRVQTTVGNATPKTGDPGWAVTWGNKPVSSIPHGFRLYSSLPAIMYCDLKVWDEIHLFRARLVLVGDSDRKQARTDLYRETLKTLKTLEEGLPMFTGPQY